MLSTKEAEKLKQQEFNKKFNEVRYRDLFLGLQFIGLIMSIILYIVSFFVPNLKGFAKIVLAILLVIMAYNNKTYVKRKNVTIIYILLSVFFLIDGIITLI